MKQLNSVISLLGLTSRQANIYLACLELGPLGITGLAQQSGEKKSTVSDVVHVLTKKGFLSESKKGRRRLYVAEQPETIGNMYTERVSQFKLAIPLLESLKKRNPQCGVSVKYYQGHAEVKQMFEELLNFKEHCYWGSIKTVRELLGQRYYLRWVKRRIERNIRVRGLRVKSGEIKEEMVMSQDSKYLREFRYVPSDFLVGSSLVLYANHVAFMSTAREHFGFVVESQEFYQTMKNLFDMMWKSAQSS